MADATHRDPPHRRVGEFRGRAQVAEPKRERVERIGRKGIAPMDVEDISNHRISPFLGICKRKPRESHQPQNFHKEFHIYILKYLLSDR